jgi:hypothetical protein
MKSKTIRVTLMLIVYLSLIFNRTQNVHADEKSGKLTIIVADQETQLSNMNLLLYKVGNVDELDESLISSGVDLGELTTADALASAAKTLAEIVGDSSIEPLLGTTDSNGQVVFDNLTQGRYLIVQTGSIENGEIAPMLISVPYSEDGKDWQYDVSVYPKAQAKPNSADLTVTKEIYYIDDDSNRMPLVSEDSIYQVGLFNDANGEIPYGEDYVQSIEIQNGSSGSVTFRNLSSGTYYLFELDSENKPIATGDFREDRDGNMWVCEVDTDVAENNHQVILDLDTHPHGTATIRNIYMNFSDGYYLEEPTETETKEITITNEYEKDREDKEDNNESIESKKTTKRVSTGDFTSIGFWIGVLGIIGIIVLIILYLKCKRDNNRK